MKREYWNRILALPTRELVVERERLRREIEADNLTGKSPRVQLFRLVEAEIARRKSGNSCFRN